ncbi:MAG: hypothetical protein PVJ40_07915, partial [Gammaproteobacteria bacterium]
MRAIFFALLATTVLTARSAPGQRGRIRALDRLHDIVVIDEGRYRITPKTRVIGPRGAARLPTVLAVGMRVQYLPGSGRAQAVPLLVLR